MENLKSKALNSTFWSFVETFSNLGFQFIVGIILARLLLPEDYGLIGVLTIFISVAGVLIDSGFKTTIIRSRDLNDIDCSTIFYVNLLVSIIIAVLFFFAAGYIAAIFERPELVKVTQVLALIPVLNGIGLVQSARLFKNLEFRRNAIVSIVSNLLSGTAAIFLALEGYSYWALVWKVLLGAAIYDLLLWVSGRWHPAFVFSFERLKSHFRFSSRLLMTGMIDAVFTNMYSFVFGKFFSFKELGFYTRGKGYVDMVTRTLSIAIQKVNTPLMSASGNDNNSKISAYSRLLHLTALLIFPATALLVAAANPMIVFLIGEKWQPAVPFLQVLAVAGLIYPVLNANSSLFEVLGRSDIILKSALICRPVQVIILIITINYSALAVAYGFVFSFLFNFCLSFYFVSKITGHSVFELLKVLFLPFCVSGFMGSLVFITGILLNENLPDSGIFFIQTFLGIGITVFLFYILKIKDLVVISDIIKEKYFQLKSRH